MLDPWIIEEIVKKEREEQRQERPVLEIHPERPELPETTDRAVEEDEVERGVVIVDFCV